MGLGSRRCPNATFQPPVCTHIVWWISAQTDLAREISFDGEERKSALRML